MAVDTASQAPATPSPPRRRGRRIVRGVGKTFIALGVLVLLFIVYELFGTDVVTNRRQDQLRESIGSRGLPARPIPGDALGFIRIPEIDLDMVFVEGSDVEPLKKGPGHYEQTPLPGEGGNVGIAGHRTTYARPFWALDELERGDVIEIQTRRGTFRYEVRWQRVVAPTEVSVLDPTARPSLTLTTCHPRFSARERLIVRAVQISGPGTPRDAGVS